jgi:heptosyltransferase-1
MSEADRESNAILVVRLGAMGDILHALPAATSLKLSFPERKLTWVVEQMWSPLLRGNPYIDRVVSFERHRSSTWNAARRELREWQYDLAVDFQGLIKSAVVARLAKPLRIYGFAKEEVRERPAALLYTDQISSAAIHRVDRALDLAVAAGAGVLTRDSRLPAGEPEGILPDSPFILASPFAGWASKQWPIEYFDELGAILQKGAGMALVINAPPSAGQSLMSLRHVHPHFSGLDGLIHATRRAFAVVGVDSGPMHLAAALRKPGVAIFGPTDPAINGPYGGTIAVLRAPGAPTSYKREDSIAPSMREISPQQVWNRLKEILT